MSRHSVNDSSNPRLQIGFQRGSEELDVKGLDLNEMCAICVFCGKSVGKMASNFNATRLLQFVQ